MQFVQLIVFVGENAESIWDEIIGLVAFTIGWTRTLHVARFDVLVVRFWGFLDNQSRSNIGWRLCSEQFIEKTWTMEEAEAAVATEGGPLVFVAGFDVASCEAKYPDELSWKLQNFLAKLSSLRWQHKVFDKPKWATCVKAKAQQTFFHVSAVCQSKLQWLWVFVLLPTKIGLLVHSRNHRFGMKGYVVFFHRLITRSMLQFFVSFKIPQNFKILHNNRAFWDVENPNPIARDPPRTISVALCHHRQNVSNHVVSVVSFGFFSDDDVYLKAESLPSTSC